MEEKNQQSKKARADFAFGISRSEFLTSIVIGIGSGLATAAKTVSDLFNDDARHASAFKKHFEDRTKLLDDIDLQTMLKEGKTKGDYHKAISGAKRAIAVEFSDIALRRRGVSKNPLIGSFDRFKLLSPNSKRELYFAGAVGASVGAALTLGFFNGVATRDKIERIEDAVGADPALQQAAAEAALSGPHATPATIHTHHPENQVTRVATHDKMLDTAEAALPGRA